MKNLGIEFYRKCIYVIYTVFANLSIVNCKEITT